MKIPFLIGASGVVAAIFAAQAATADSLLDKHTKQLQDASELKVQYTVQSLPDGPQDYKLTLGKPGLYKLETQDETIVADGTNVWDYKKADNSYTQTAQGDSDLKAFLKKDAVLAWTAFFQKEPFKDITNPKVGAKRNLKGKAVTEVSFGLPGKPERTATLFIDSESGVARGVSIKSGTDKETLVIAKEVELSTDPAKTSDFAFSAPDGAKKVDPATASVTFAQVSTIFQASCTGCHNSTRPRSGLDLTTYQAAMAGGRGGKDITPGDADGSPLMAYLKGANKPQMPPRGPLSDKDIATIASWIKGGAKEN